MLLTLSFLEEIIGLKSEIRAKAAKLQREMGDGYLSDNYVADTVNDYSTGFPRPIKIEGYAPLNPKKVEALRKDIKTKQLLVDAAEEAIATITDSQMRTILTLRFLEGLEWADVARHLYKKATADSVRMRVTRYFEKM